MNAFLHWEDQQRQISHGKCSKENDANGIVSLRNMERKSIDCFGDVPWTGLQARVQQ